MSDATLTIAGRFLDAARRFADRTAYEDPDTTLTFGALEERALLAAAGLARRGVEPGRRVAIVLDEGAEYLATLIGCWLAGAIAVPVNRSQVEDKTRFILEQSAPHLIVAAAEDPLLALVPAVPSVTPAALDDGASPARPAAIVPETDAMILYTSGTTGVPKGVLHSHLALALNAVEMSAMLGLGTTDRLLVNIPFYYSNAISHLLMSLFNGATICSRAGFLFGEPLLAAIRDTRATGFGGVPAHYVRLADAFGSEPQSTSLRFLMNSGDHLPVNVLRSLQGLFPGAEIFCAYGISECAPRVCCLDPDLVREKEGSVGRPLPATAITVRDEAGAEVPAGELGEVYVTSRCLMKAYYANPEATAECMTAHGFRTGDMGYVDADGCLFLTGRLDSVFKSGGEKVSCRLIEETLRESTLFAEQLQDVVVRSREDHYVGKVPCAYYVAGPGATVDVKAIRRELRRSLPKSHVPSHFVQVREIRRSASGKVEREALLDASNLIDG